MGNSPLVNYTKISPNKTSPRKGVIDTITIHHMAGNCTVEVCGEIFAPTSRKASSNYAVDNKGRIGMYVEEKDRSWCSSSGANDNRAITIEVANDGGASTNWHISDIAIDTLIKLCVDICKRNNIPELRWKADKSLIGQVDKQNMTVHRWFAPTSCPGDYLYSKLGEIASRVNAELNKTAPAKPSTKTLYRVIAGSFSTLSKTANQVKKLKLAGFESVVVKVGSQYRIQVGAFSSKLKAQAFQKDLKKKGFESFLTLQSGTVVNNIPTIQKGSRVKVKKGAKTYTGGNISSFVYNKVYTVDSLVGDRAVLDKKGICTPVNVKDLILQ